MTRVVLALAALVIPFAFVHAGLIALGLDWRKNVFVQETWQDGKPSYTIANLSDAPVTVSISDRKGNLLPLGPWPIAKGGVVTVDASKLVDQGLMAWKLADGSSLGLLNAPTKSVEGGVGIVSVDGLNASGGRHQDIWIEQPDAVVAPGKDFAVTLKIQGKIGVVKWSKKDEKNNAITQLGILDAKSDTLPVAVKGDTIEIDANNPIKDAKVHAVTLRFHAPAAIEPTMAMISGWRTTNQKGGHGVTRGIVVSAGKK